MFQQTQTNVKCLDFYKNILMCVSICEIKHAFFNAMSLIDASLSNHNCLWAHVMIIRQELNCVTIIRENEYCAK